MREPAASHQIITFGTFGNSGNCERLSFSRCLSSGGLSAKMSGIILNGRKLGFMDQLAGLMGSRRNEDIALDMMKFIAASTGYGKTGSPGAGFQGGTVNKAEDYAEHLLDLYTRCLNTVNGKK